MFGSKETAADKLWKEKQEYDEPPVGSFVILSMTVVGIVGLTFMAI